MSLCRNVPDTGTPKTVRAHVLVPIALLVAGLALLPFACVYNRIFALMLVGIAGASLVARASELYCCLKGRARHLAAQAPEGVSSCL